MSSDELVERAVRILRAGGLVAFPTETVYGLGADAENVEAVERLFRVKRRPETHPLIVHLRTPDDLPRVASDVPRRARLLGDRFWPGPLTLVLRRAERLPKAVTGGQDSVAVRLPSHPLARALLERFAGVLAAPSANRFGRVSPTRAAHVEQDLGADVDLVLDGGACAVGVESTILDLTGRRPALLRPGGVPREAIEEALGESIVLGGDDAPRVPGRLPSHYAPRTPLEIVRRGELGARVLALRGQGLRVAVLAPARDPGVAADLWREIAEHPDGYARDLYAELRALDEVGVDVALVVPPVAHGLGAAVLDRLERAAASRPGD